MDGPIMLTLLDVHLEGFLQVGRGPWTFDILSALVGVAVASLLAFLIYRNRARLAVLRQNLQERAVSTEARAMRGHGARYRDAVLGQANRWHLAGHLIALERVGVAPRFVPVPPPYDPFGELHDELEGPYAMVPLVPEYPQAAGAYGMPGTDLLHVLRGAPAIAVLGAPGSGRSTALAMMAMIAAKQSQLDEREWLSDELLTPVLFHLGDVDLSPEALFGEKDPANFLLAAAQRRMTGRLARSASSAIPNALASGVCLLLADGWDELPDTQRARVLEWLGALMEIYPGNRLVMAGPSRGYGPLVEFGLTPVYLLPWGDREFALLAQRWAEAWPDMSGSRRQRYDPPDPNTVRQVAAGNRARSPLDVTLKAWTTYARDGKGEGRAAWYSAYVDRMMPVPEVWDAFQRLAVEAIAPDADGEIGLAADEVKAFLDAALARLGRMAMDTPDFLHEITNKNPFLVERAGGRYTFSHPVIGGFLAAESLAASGQLDSLHHADEARNIIMPFLAAARDVTDFVEERLDAEPEVACDTLLETSAWAVDAPTDAVWRDKLLRGLTQALLSPSQFPVVRERILAGVVASRDPKMAAVFRQGLRAENALARALSALGLGALGDPTLIEDIAYALDDTETEVQVAATLALAAIGGEEATEYLIQLLFEGREPVRRAVAESLASEPEVGHALLREAISEEDVLVRRAAIYGLARVSEPWALGILEECQVQDDEWFVRDAAREAVERFETGTTQRVPAVFPLPEHMVWLVEWAAEQGESVPQGGPQAIDMLIRVLQEGDDEARFAATDTLGKIGGWEAVKPLYATLRDSSPTVREAAYRSLTSISQAVGRGLPAVVG
jgi:HEAT repeat protein